MSYVIQLWEQPVPASLEEAEAILEQLLREDAGVPSSRLDQLVKLLWARYPRDLDTAPGDPVWADTFPRNGRTPLQVETLAIAAPHLDEVVPVVAKAATELGLVAYDPQYGTVYLPGGRRLGRAPAEAHSLFQRHGSTLRIPLNSRAKLESALGKLQQILPRVFDDMRAVETVAGLWQSALAEARGQRKAHFSESIEAKLVAGAMQGSPHLDMVVAEELARYEARLAQRRQGASAARLDMLEAEEGRTRESLARLLEFARTRVSVAC